MSDEQKRLEECQQLVLELRATIEQYLPILHAAEHLTIAVNKLAADMVTAEEKADE